MPAYSRPDDAKLITYPPKLGPSMFTVKNIRYSLGGVAYAAGGVIVNLPMDALPINVWISSIYIEDSGTSLGYDVRITEMGKNLSGTDPGIVQVKIQVNDPATHGASGAPEYAGANLPGTFRLTLAYTAMGYNA